MSTLNEFVNWCKLVDITGKNIPFPKLFPHYIHYTRFLIEEQLNIKLTLEETEYALYMEGLLGDEYYFSDWFIKKYRNKDKVIIYGGISPQAKMSN